MLGRRRRRARSRGVATSTSGRRTPPGGTRSCCTGSGSRAVLPSALRRGAHDFIDPLRRLSERVVALVILALAVAGLGAPGAGREGVAGGPATLLSAGPDSVFRRVGDVETLATARLLQEVAAIGSRRAADPERIAETDALWRRGEIPDGVFSLLENTASRFLHEVIAEDAAYRELLVADKHGRLVAASGITSDYYQADEELVAQRRRDRSRQRDQHRVGRERPSLRSRGCRTDHSRLARAAADYE